MPLRWKTTVTMQSQSSPQQTLQRQLAEQQPLEAHPPQCRADSEPPIQSQLRHRHTRTVLVLPPHTTSPFPLPPHHPPHQTLSCCLDTHGHDCHSQQAQRPPRRRSRCPTQRLNPSRTASRTLRSRSLGPHPQPPTQMILMPVEMRHSDFGHFWALHGHHIHCFGSGRTIAVSRWCQQMRSILGPLTPFQPAQSHQSWQLPSPRSLVSHVRWIGEQRPWNHPEIPTCRSGARRPNACRAARRCGKIATATNRRHTRLHCTLETA